MEKTELWVRPRRAVRPDWGNKVWCLNYHCYKLTYGCAKVLGRYTRSPCPCWGAGCLMMLRMRMDLKYVK